ncbi:MAG: FAD/NAD(P)-binding protein [Anaerolineales bacterium]|nr:MAG: FAD/NAD(P)-binding protein [Anaerolineales bacterium]
MVAHTPTITIIGGGASGTLLAVQLARQASAPLKIHLIEQHGPAGRGVAYDTTTPAHRLNVPANKMGAYPDHPGHFHEWLVQNGHDFATDAFVPRQLYSQYLQDQLQAAQETPGVQIVLIHDEALEIEVQPGRAEVALASGRVLTSDAVVLAFGNFLPPQPGFLSPQAAAAPKYFANPWQPDLAASLAADDRVLVIGMGLTAVDTLLSLQGQQHRGPLYAISTHGWWPAVHQLGHIYPDFAAELAGLNSLPTMLRVLRRHLNAAATQGSNWRAVIDALRPNTQALWHQLPPAEKRRFMRHLRRLWDVSRHRMPQECAAALDTMHASRQLHSLRGRITAVEFNGEEFSVTFRSPHGEQALQVDAIVNCMGSESNYARLPSRLVQNLLARQLIKPDALSQGLEAGPDGLLGPRLYTLGTALKGMLWESTAMPEIRAQAQQLAAQLLDSLP